MTGHDIGVALPLDEIVGRDEELALVARLLDETRFVTVTGLGGAGKTRLAVEIARRWTASPVIVIDLSTVRDAALFATVVADGMGLDALPQVEPEQVVAQRIAAGSLLLVLDNLEQIPAAGRVIRRWLMAAPDVRALVTSRLPLSVPGERIVVLQPLPCGAASAAAGPSPAARLFLREAVRTGGLDHDEADPATVERIVQRLGGIPLAIELVAARARVSSIAQVEARLAPPDGEPAILDDVLAWTVSLQSPEVRDAFIRLGAVPGPFGTALLEDLWPGLDVLGTLAELVAASLIRRGPERDSWELLVPVREYALERSSALHETDATMQRLFQFVLRHGVDLDATIPGSTDAQRYATLARHHAVVQAVVAWAIRSDPATGADLVGRLGTYWWRVGAAREAHDVTRSLLSVRDLPDAIRARLLTTAADVDLEAFGPTVARPIAEAAVALAKRTADDAVTMDALLALARVLGQLRDHDAALALLDETLVIARRRDDPAHEVSILGNRAVEFLQSGRFDAARVAVDEAYAAAESRGLTFFMAMALGNGATIDIAEGRATQALTSVSAARDLVGPFGPGSFTAWLLTLHAHAALAAHDTFLARSLVLEAAPAVASRGSWEERALLLEIASGVLHRTGADHDAARLLGTADMVRRTAGRPDLPKEDHDIDELRVAVRRRCGDRAYERLTAAGAHDDVGRVLASLTALLVPTAADDATTSRLTPREREVAHLVAAGASDAEIADRLAMSPKTASVHVSTIKRKYGLDTRLQLVVALGRERMAT